MPRLQTLLECVGQAICENGGPPRNGQIPMGNTLFNVIHAIHDHLCQRAIKTDLRTALREAVSVPQETVELALRDAVSDLPGQSSEDERIALTNFLELLPSTVRQFLRRPGDPAGTSLPEHLPVETPEDWLVFFPDRLTRFKAGERLEQYDNWQLMDLRGLGPYSETWRCWTQDHPQNATASLKFVTDPHLCSNFVQHEDLFRRILDLEPMSGLVQLRSVYLLTDPPCLESSFVSGYDAMGLMRDWRWRTERTKPDQAALIIKRVAKIVGALHQMDPPIVHRGLKPSNILLHPTSEGKVSIWVSDIGWGEIATAHALTHVDPLQAYKLTRCGAYSPTYASPQQKEGQPPDPRDDIFALGVIWYQLLHRDPSVALPEDHEWAMDFRAHGLSDGHARLLASCIDENPDHRPANGLVLAAQIDANFGSPIKDDSRSFVIKGSSTTARPLKETVAVRSKVPTVDAELPHTFVNSIGMEFVLVPVGSFLMGSPDNEKGRHDWEGPVHLVHITRPFYLGLAPVTQSQYLQLMGRNPSHFTRTFGGGPDHPVEQVSWDDAVALCEKLIDMPEEVRYSHIYRLPTEAEWEYACRAGTKTPYCFGETVTLQQVHYFGLNASSWAKVAGTAGKTEKVGSHAPNAWGLFDMHGNVLEWCNDWWSEDYYQESPEADPAGPKNGTQRVARGGSFSQFAADCRSAARLGRASNSRLNTVGFRVAMTIPGR